MLTFFFHVLAGFYSFYYVCITISFDVNFYLMCVNCVAVQVIFPERISVLCVENFVFRRANIFNDVTCDLYKWYRTTITLMSCRTYADTYTAMFLVRWLYIFTPSPDDLTGSRLIL